MPQAAPSLGRQIGGKRGNQNKGGSCMDTAAAMQMVFDFVDLECPPRQKSNQTLTLTSSSVFLPFHVGAKSWNVI